MYGNFEFEIFWKILRAEKNIVLIPWIFKIGTLLLNIFKYYMQEAWNLVS